jgi:site-specific DNA-cytosine methylase/site-specific DNA-adenine methylase
MKKSNVIGKTIKNLELIVSNVVNTIGDMKLFSYAGSKTKFKPKFHHTVEKMGANKVGIYIEAFAGSLASMFHNLELITADKIVINDVNKRLINLYIQIQNNPQNVFTVFEMIEDKFQSMILDEIPRKGFVPKKFRKKEFKGNRDFYNHIRSEFNNIQLDIYNAGMFLFIMNHNYNGKYNENKKGGFNISFNWKAGELKMDKIKTNLFNLSKFFNDNNVVFESLDIDSLISKYNDHDTFIYLDPPYIDTDIQYNQARIGTKKKPSHNSFMDISTHLKMIDSCSKYKYVMYSNNHHKDFVSTFDGFVNFERSHSVSNKKSEKSKKEILAFKVNAEVSTVSQQIPELSIENATKIVSLPSNNILEVKKVSNGADIITTASICSGGGASEDSLKQLGFNSENHRNLFMCELDDKVSEVYKMNFKSENYFKDFYKVDWRKVEKEHLNLLFISTPCTEFSIASGQRKNLDSQKGQLYIDALSQARKFNVDKIINENVSSIVSSGKHFAIVEDKDGKRVEINYIPTKKQLKKENWKLLKSEKNKYVYKSHFNPKLTIGRTLKIVEDILIKDFRDYSIYMDVLNTKDFNTPQNRSRFFMVMIKKNLDFGFQFPQKQELTTKMIDLLEKNVSDKYTINREFIKYEDRLFSDPKQLNIYGEVLKKDGTKSNYRSSKIILYPEMCSCLTTKCQIKIYHQNKLRTITPIEMLRLHGFSKDYKLPKTHSLSTHIMGNTLSPVVMKELINGVLFMNTPKVNNTDYENEQEITSLAS